MLKAGRVAIIADYKNTASYARVFRDAGLAVNTKFYLLDTFFPVSIVHAPKPRRLSKVVNRVQVGLDAAGDNLHANAHQNER